MNKQAILLCCAVIPILVSASQPATRLVVMDVDGKETHIDVSHELEISATSGNLVFAGVDDSVTFEISQVNGFYYIDDHSSAADDAIVPTPVSIVLNDSSLGISVGADTAGSVNVRIYSDSGAIVETRDFCGETEIPLSSYRKGVYIIAVDGVETIKIYVR